MEAGCGTVQIVLLLLYKKGILAIVRRIKRDYLSSAVSTCGRVEGGFEIAGGVEGKTRRRGGRTRKSVWRSVQSVSYHYRVLNTEERRDRDMGTRTMTPL